MLPATHYKNWFPTILWMILIFIVSSIPSLKVTNNSVLQNLINNLGHFTEYAVLTLLTRRSLKLQGTQDHLSFRSFSFSFLYALSDEFHQHFVPGRTMDPHDLLFDALGSLIALLFLTTYYQLRTTN
ncbi:MAG: VanZ family protein [Bacteroidetes bacterium]|nr:MAG: VanZ family protein [Bacteroidota bacterium]